MLELKKKIRPSVGANDTEAGRIAQFRLLADGARE
jgi:hypothetical protein